MLLLYLLFSIYAPIHAMNIIDYADEYIPYSTQDELPIFTYEPPNYPLSRSPSPIIKQENQSDNGIIESFDPSDEEPILCNKKRKKKRRKQTICPQECPVCEKSIRGLTRHMRIHSGDKPYKCTYCEECFTQNCNRKRHEYVHHLSKDEPVLKTRIASVSKKITEYRAQCIFCQKYLVNKKVLETHYKRHHIEIL